MLAFGFAITPTLKWVHLVIVLLSYLPLLEFGRLGLKKHNIKVPGRWIYVLVPLIVCIDAVTGIYGASAAALHILEISGLLLAGIVLIQEARHTTPQKSKLFAASGTSVILISIIKVSSVFESILPSSHISTNALLQSIETILSMVAVYCIWTVYRQSQNSPGETHMFRFAFIPGVMAVLLVLGWWLAGWHGQIIDLQLRKNLLNQAVSIAETIDPEQVNTLSFTSKDIDNPKYRRLCDQMAAYAGFMGQKGICSIEQRDGQFYFGPKSYKHNNALISISGTRYMEPPDGFGQLFHSTKANTIGPYVDEYGTVISAYAPVLDTNDSHVIMLIGVDFVADTWKQTIALARLLPILFTLALMTIIMIFSSFLAWRCRLSVEFQAKYRFLETALIAAVGIVLSFASAYLADNSESRTRQITFSQLAESQVSRIVEAMQDIRDKQLPGLARFFESNEKVTSAAFSHYAESMLTDNVVTEIGWAPRIDSVSGHDEAFPVSYVEPHGQKNSVIGFNLASEPRTKTALNETLNTGMPTITDTMRPASNNDQALSVFMPIRKTYWATPIAKLSTNTHASANGVVYLTLNVDSLVRKSTQYLMNTYPDFYVHMYQLDKNGLPLNINLNKEATHYSTPTSTILSEYEIKETSTILPLLVFGKAYALVVNATPEYLAANPKRDGWQTGTAGLLLTAILSTLTTILVNRRVDLENQVQARTIMLTESEEEHRRLIENAVSGFALFEIQRDEYDIPKDYVFINVNKAFEAQTGLQAENIIGLRVSQVIPDIVDTDVSKAFWEVALKDQSISLEQYLECLSRHFYINAYKAGKDRIAAFVLDISARKHAEEEIRKSREQYMLAVNGSKDGIWDWNLLDNSMFLSTKWKQMIGYEDWELPNLYSTYEERIHPEDQLMVSEALSSYLKSEIVDYIMEFRFLHRDGKYIWIMSRGEALRDEFGVAYRMVGSHTDITARKQVEVELNLINLQLQNAIEEASHMAMEAELSKHELDSERASLQAIFDAAQVGMLLIDTGFFITKVNDSVGQLVGRNMPDLLGQCACDGLSCIHAQHTSYGSVRAKACADCLLYNTVIGVHESGVVVRGEEIAQRLVIDNQERLFYFSINASPIEIDDKRQVLLAIMDITDRKQTEVVLKQQAHHDPLTGLPNRLQFNKTLSSIVHSRRKTETKIGVMFIDLDRFKVVNDSLGHDIGDLLLVEVSRRLNLCVREHDTLCRMGGDEFTIILRPLSGIDAINIVANRIFSEIDRPFTVKEHVINIGASIGASIYPQDGTDVASIVKKADTAMYKAKELGRNNCQIYTSDMDTDTRKRMKMERELRMALANEQFVVHYQPRTDPLTGRFQGAETLVRWYHPKRGLLLPLEFLSVAEESGIIVQIDDYVFRTVCARLRLWIDAGYSPDCVSVHFSEAQMRRPNCTEYITKYLDMYDLKASSIAIEIPGASLLCIPNVVLNALQELREQGMNVILDDFGTGPVSLLTLNKATVDSVKLDGSLLRGVSGDNWDNVAVAASITSSAHNLGLQVIAVGVETFDQMLLVGSLMCDTIQGNQISPPLCIEEFEQYLRTDVFDNSNLTV